MSQFTEWLEGQRSVAESAAREAAAVGASPSVFVIDAGADVDTAMAFSGVTWQVLSDLSTNGFGDGAAEVVVHFPGLRPLGCEVFDVFAEIFTSAKTGNVGSSSGGSGGGGGFKPLVELARLEVTASPVPGPALVLRSLRPRSEVETDLALQRRDNSRAAAGNEQGCVESVRAFVSRVVVGGASVAAVGKGDSVGSSVSHAGGKGACPYTTSEDLAATGLAKQGVTPGPVAYRFEACSDALDGMAACWRSFAEVLNTPESELSTTLLCLPAVAPPPTTTTAPALPLTTRVSPEDESQGRFLAFTDLVTQSLLLYGADKLLGLVYFHPLYDRDAVQPPNDAVYGHIPPLSWLPAMAQRSGLGSPEDLERLASDPAVRSCSNWQRRAPLLVVNVLRASQLAAATGGLSVVDLEVPALPGTLPTAAGGGGGGEGAPSTRVVKASGVRTYARNALKLASDGDLELLLELAGEMNTAFPEQTEAN